ncbi:amidoligase family protein [Thiomicrorhabdus indica]|uniref:amidoligase family protein n=1 Tax=Thiomicrorhabdus indica TaxID=2267253 RepID=UPI002AA89A10|nr:amidoligase family protein [Thiomicrorhabdus indica]
MKNPMAAQIAEQLEQSKHWEPLNRDTMEFHRFEGTKPEAEFNRELLAHLMTFDHFYKRIQHRYACGFEIEFYLVPEQIPFLEQTIAALLPKSQMLLIDLNKPIKTNGRHFYLMAENTGKAPEGLKSYELVSPILDPKSLPYFLTTLLNTLNTLQAQDNQHLGFHLHISTEDPDPISPIALLFFLDQNRCFDWPERQFTRDLVRQFFEYPPQDWQLIFEEITRKCYNLNLLHYPENNRIELRSVGGTSYLQQSKKIIENSLNALISFEQAKKTPVLEIATQIKKRFSPSKNIQPLNRVDYRTLLKSCDQSRTKQMWFSTIRPTTHEE